MNKPRIPGDYHGVIAARLAADTRSPRPLYAIAYDIKVDWKSVYYGAAPYLQAMRSLDSMQDKYGADDAESIVLYFLSNATSWRGSVARQLKAELKGMLR